YLYGKALTKLGRGNESRQYYERAVEVDPTFGPAVQELVDIYEAGNEFGKAAAALQPLIADDPVNIEMQRRQAYLYLRAGETAKAQLAFIERQKGNYAAAIDEVRPVLVFRDKPNAQAVNTALEAMKKQKRYTDAVALLQPLVDKYASDPFVNARYVEFLLRAGDKDRARVAASTQAKFGGRNHA